MSAIDGFVIEPRPAVHFGVGAIDQLPGVVRATGVGQVVVVTDDALASTSVIATVRAVLAGAGIPANPTSDDLAAGAAAVIATAADAAASASAAAVTAAVTATLRASAPTTPAASRARSAPSASRIALVAVGGGSAIDAAKGIAIAAVNPQRGR